MNYKVIFFSLVFFVSSLIPAFADESQQTCTYQAFRWSVNLRKAVAYETITQPYNNLKPDEIDSLTGCTVCEDDQETIHIQSLAPFRICKKIAPTVKDALAMLIQSGEPIFEVIAYRVGRTRGEADANGNRTGFSNHSYGAAIDINPLQNGLYDNCVSFNANCRLICGLYCREEQFL